MQKALTLVNDSGVLALTGTVLAVVSFMLVSRFTSQLIPALRAGGYTRSVVVGQAPGILGDLIVASTFMAGITTTTVGNIMLLVGILCLVIALKKKVAKKFQEKTIVSRILYTTYEST